MATSSGLTRWHKSVLNWPAARAWAAERSPVRDVQAELGCLRNGRDRRILRACRDRVSLEPVTRVSSLNTRNTVFALTPATRAASRMVVKDRLQAGHPFRRLADPGDADRDGSRSHLASAGTLPGEGPVVEHAPHRDDAVRVDGVDHVLPEPDGCADAGESDPGPA